MCNFYYNIESSTKYVHIVFPQCTKPFNINEIYTRNLLNGIDPFVLSNGKVVEKRID